MLPLLIAATVLVLASKETRGLGLLLFGLLVHLHPNLFAGILIILGIIWMFLG